MQPRDSLRGRRAPAVALLLAALLVAPRARAADVEGVIVALDGGELVVDLGALRGAHEGDVVELWRPLQLRHPLTGRPLVERFRTGALRLTQVRPALALATVEGTPSRAPAAGDIVVLHRESPAPPAKPPSSTKPPRPAATADPYEDLASKPPPAGSAPAPVTSAPAVPPGSAPAPGADPEADALATMLTELTGAPPAVRAARYRAFTLRWPVGRSVRVLNEEAAMLQSIDATLPRGTSPSFDAPRATLAGRPLSLAIELPGNSVGAVVNVRSAGETTYQTVPMKAAGPGYFRSQLAAEMIRGPEILYFIEAVGSDGQLRPVEGDASHPRRVEVLEPGAPRRLGQGPITAAIWVDYANYNRLRSNDYMVQTEGYFGVRIGDEGVRAVRSGFGVLRGVGGTLRELDEEKLPGRSVGLTYGYLEGEWGVSRTLSFITRGVIGLRRSGVSGGGQLFVRLGNDLHTNLLLGGEFLGGVGLRGITQLEWRTIPRVPIVLRTEVTNQPAGEEVSDPETNPDGTPKEASGKGEIGLRAIVQAGYELTPALTLSARASYQGRTINHAGPGLGAAVTYQW